MVFILKLIESQLFPLGEFTWEGALAGFSIASSAEFRAEYVVGVVYGGVCLLKIAREVGEPDDWLGDAEGTLDGTEAECIGEVGG